MYEHSTVAEKDFIRFATIPGMWDRTVSLYSAGKIFSCTGWRVGYMIGPGYLLKPVHNYFEIIGNGVNQMACVVVNNAYRLAAEPYEGYDSYWSWFNHELSKKC